MADYYNQLGNIFLEENNEEQFILYTMKGLELAKEEGLKEQVRDASYLLYVFYRDNSQYEEALDYQSQYHAYKDSIQNLETTQRLANLRTEFEVGQKQAEVDLLLEQRRSNQIIMITGGIILLAVIGLVIIIFTYFRAKNRLNQQLEEQKDSLIKLNQTKDKFFSIISHDLRGPVNNLSGLISVTKYFIEDQKNDELKEMMNRMEDSVGKLVNLLDNLLNWALQQRGYFPNVPEKINAQNLLEDIMGMFKDMALSKEINTKLNIEEDFDLYVDKNTTSTIFRNLINNAIKFTKAGGTIEVEAVKDQANGFGIIHVKDTGIGMPAEKLQSLFKLNENISTKGTSGETGLGLGLQLVKEFVQQNKGEITLESEEGKGTTFSVKLPLFQD
jgi:signal transduction histidine kinase